MEEENKEINTNEEVVVTEQDKEQQDRKKFLKSYDSKKVRPQRRNLFDDFTQINSYELPLQNTYNDLVISLHQKKTDETEHLLKFQIGKTSMFIDAKISFYLAEAIRVVCDSVVPPDLRPIEDKRGGSK